MSLVMRDGEEEFFYDNKFYEIDVDVAEYSEHFIMTEDGVLLDVLTGNNVKISRRATKLSASTKLVATLDNTGKLRIFRAKTLDEIYTSEIDPWSNISVVDDKVIYNSRGIYYVHDMTNNTFRQDNTLHGETVSSCDGYVIYNVANCFVGSADDLEVYVYYDDEPPIWLDNFKLDKKSYDDFNFQNQYTLHLISDNKLSTVSSIMPRENMTFKTENVEFVK